MTDTRDWIDLLERRERAAEARDALGMQAGETHLGRAIADARRGAGLDVEELAHLAGTSPNFLRRLEASAVELHALDLLLRIADVLGADLRLGFERR